MSQQNMKTGTPSRREMTHDTTKFRRRHHKDSHCSPDCLKSQNHKEKNNTCKVLRTLLFSILAFFQIINVWPTSPTTTEFVECPVFFFQIQRFSGLFTFGRKFPLPQFFFKYPFFGLSTVGRIFNTFPDY